MVLQSVDQRGIINSAFRWYVEKVCYTLQWMIMILVGKAGPREYVLMYIAVIMTRRMNRVLTLDAVEEGTYGVHTISVRRCSWKVKVR